MPRLAGPADEGALESLPGTHGVAALQATLNVVIAQRDLVAHLPTLPWRPGTARGLLTAVVLPLAMFVITRLIGRSV